MVKTVPPNKILSECVDVLLGGLGLTDCGVEIWEPRIAGEEVEAATRAGSRDLGVVRLHDVSWEVEEGGSCVGDGGAYAAAYGGAGSDAPAGGGEGPEIHGCVDGAVCDGAGDAGGVDEAEVVGSWGAVSQVCGEEFLAEGGFYVVEEGELLGWADGVEGAEG